MENQNDPRLRPAATQGNSAPAANEGVDVDQQPQPFPESQSGSLQGNPSQPNPPGTSPINPESYEEEPPPDVEVANGVTMSAEFADKVAEYDNRKPEVQECENWKMPDPPDLTLFGRF